MTMPLGRNVGRGPRPVDSASRTLPPASTAACELSLADPRWHAFVASHADSLAFHRPEWAELLAECYGYRPFVLAQLDTDDNVLGGLPVIETKTFGRRHW